MEKIKLGDIASVITKGTTPTSIGFNFGGLSKNRKRNEQHIKFSVPLSLPHK